jgi:rhodanese-related sulfurtransferase
MINNKRKLVILTLAGIALLGTLLPLFLAGGCPAVEDNVGESETQIIENITPGAAFDLIQANKDNPDFVILDVRTPGEFSAGRLENAINLDYYSNTFTNDLENLNRNKVYLIYCRSGRRSGSALNIMKGLNFTEVYNMSGGIVRWKAEGLPIIP